MRIPNDQPLTTKWQPFWIGYLEGILFILQSITSIFSFYLVFLWIILGILLFVGIFKIPILFIIWLIGSAAWVIFFSIAWRALVVIKPDDFQFREKIIIFIGIIINTSLVFLITIFLLKDQNLQSIILGSTLMLIIFNAPTLTIFLIFLRKKLYYLFSNAFTPQVLDIERDYSKIPQRD